MNLLFIGINSLFRTGVTAMLDSMGSTFPKAAVAALEDEKETPVSLARQSLIDEGPEVFWKTIVGSLFVKTLRNIAPWVPEQIANFPGEMLGAFLHWGSASHQAKNKKSYNTATCNSNKELGPLEKFFDSCIKKPINSVVQMIGLDENNVKFFKFGIINACLFAGGTFALKGAEEENIPGMNLDSEDPWYKSLFKTVGYTIFEQVAHCTSQTMRYYKDYKEEFGGEDGKFNKNVLAKALANVIHERAFPGNIPSAISGCLSTLFLGRYIPKSVAGAIGEAPMKWLERILTLHLRRSTKERYDKDSPGERIHNYRGHDKPWFNNILQFSDSIFNPIRNFFIENVIAKIFKPDNVSLEEYVKELKGSFDTKLEILKKGAEATISN